MSRKFARLKRGQFDELLRLHRLYGREARKCEKTKLYLPGCVLLGSALEVSLILTTHCFANEAAGCKGLPRVKGGGDIKLLLDWKLNELLRVAKQLGWLPAGLRLDEEWDSKRADIGDHAEVVRMLRNLVHPACYLADLPGKRVTSRHLKHAFKVLDAVHQRILQKLEVPLRKAVADAERRRRRLATKPPRVGRSRRASRRA